MRILLLSQWYPPEPQKVVSDLAEGLRDQGHTVTVLTGFPNYPSGKIYPGYRRRFRHVEEMNGLRIIRVPLFPDHSRSAVKRSLNYISFAVSCTLLGPWFVPRVDVVYVVHPPVTVGLPAWILSKRLGVPFVYEIQDMWPETLSATGMVSSRNVLSIVGTFAKWVYRRAAAIRVISPGFRDNLIAKGVPLSKIHVISNWVDTECYRPEKANREMAERTGTVGKFNVMFAGGIGLAQGLEHVVDAAAKLRDTPIIQFVFVGDGTALDQLKAKVETEGLTNIKFVERKPASEMSKYYALADVLLIHLRDDPLFRITIPHKTFAYLASGKPILAAVEGDVADVVTAVGGGISCPPCNPSEIASSVRRLFEMTEAKRQDLGQSGRLAAVNQYSREQLVRQISDMLRGVIEQLDAEYKVLPGSIQAPTKRAA